MTRPQNVEDYQALARKVLPKGIYEYVARGCEDDVAVDENTAAFRRIKLLQRVMVDVSRRNSAIDLFGQRLSMPLVIAPTGSAALLCYEGELVLARAAAAVGVPFVISGGAAVSMERIAKEAGGNLWFQIYMWQDEALSHQVIDRARDAGMQALIITADSAAPPNREYNIRNGFSQPFRITPTNIVDVASHPRWVWNVLLRYLTTTGLPRYQNVPNEMRDPLTGRPARMVVSSTMDWGWLDRIRRIWPRTLIVKGLMTPEDALLAAEHGADAVVVSNHGGRNLDSSPATLDVLPDIVNAVGHRLTVLLDGGIRRGSDIVKARALGATAVLAGRPPLYGAAVDGEAGVKRVMALLARELDTTLALIGCSDIGRLDSSYLRLPGAQPLPVFAETTR
jgi:isopentenyl diphosphate isomerase/L-lactate dehydrogenase-like FMN-dependent dehydrogenase